MNTTMRTRLTVLGTLSDLHRGPIAYDLGCLRTLVVDLAPDLLCAEITREAWEDRDLSHTTFEVREALAPVVKATDIVLVPIASSPQQFKDFAGSPGWRRDLASTFDRVLRWGQRRANRPEVVNGTLFELFCHTICILSEMTWTKEDRAVWKAQNATLAENILEAVQRDGGRRVLVAVQCQRLHQLLPILRAHTDLLEVVNYQAL